MKTYPSIPAVIQMGLPVYAFNKIDGSCIRAEWSKKRGFYKFGSRTRLLGTDQNILIKAEDLIKENENIISDICKKNRWERIVLFYEFAGQKSSFGIHEEDDEHKVHLIDACPYKQGIIPPRDFIEYFSDPGLNPAQCLYRGICNNSFVKSVNDGTLDGMGSEGVVCKVKGKGNTIVRFKIKRLDWYSRFKEHCSGDEKLFETLK